MRVIETVYERFVRPQLPRKFGVFNGVICRRPRLLDKTDFRPHNKQGVIEAITQHVSSGDRVVEVGSGYGVCTVHVARQRADVVTFEAAADVIDELPRTLRLNGVLDRVEYRHALVGTSGAVNGSAANADLIEPSDLPDGDVLLLDCEGGEKEIVPAVADQYSTVIVESHPERGASASDVASWMPASHRISSRSMQEPDEHRDSKRVIIGQRPTAEGN